MVRDISIVIPIWKSDLTYNEEISLRQSLSILNEHHFSIVTHDEIDLEIVLNVFEEFKTNYQVVTFPKRYFLGTEGYNKLMLSVGFYFAFIKYKYILIYQLDCFVFKDELEFWMDQEYSYIGAPWLKYKEKKVSETSILGVGNGGLSLRKVRDHFRVLLSFRHIKPFDMLLHNFLYSKSTSFAEKLTHFLSNLSVSNNTFFLFNDWNTNEDFFWAKQSQIFSWFSIPEWRIAARFSVESEPRQFYNYLDDIPFGCHAWWSYDLEFWKPYIEHFGHDIEP